MHVYIVEEFYELNCVDCVFKCIILFKSVPVNRQIWYFVTKQVMFVSTHIICKILSILSAENKHFLFSVIYYGCAFIQSSLKYTLKIHFMGYHCLGIKPEFLQLFIACNQIWPSLFISSHSIQTDISDS